MDFTKALVTVVLKPLSRLPFGVLYFISDLLYLPIRYLIGYRKKVVWSNLKTCFPDREHSSLKKTMNGFYRHFCDLIVETVKLGSIRKEDALKRCKVLNPELMNDLYEEGKSIIVIAGHYNNWELAAMVQPLFFKYKGLGIYSPLRNPTLDSYIRETRSRFGMELVPKKRTLKTMLTEVEKGPVATCFLSDQSPKRSQNAYWTQFLNRETGIPFGAGAYAVRYDMPVVYGGMEKVKRGHYEITFKLITKNPREMGAEGILESYNKLLESEILKKPEYWLWSHKRWKHKRSVK